jgi:hypothetical protein
MGLDPRSARGHIHEGTGTADLRAVEGPTHGRSGGESGQIGFGISSEKKVSGERGVRLPLTLHSSSPLVFHLGSAVVLPSCPRLSSTSPVAAGCATRRPGVCWIVVSLLVGETPSQVRSATLARGASMVCSVKWIESVWVQVECISEQRLKAGEQESKRGEAGVRA